MGINPISTAIMNGSSNMISIQDLREVAPGIFYVNKADSLVSVGADIVVHLQNVAASIPIRRARLCTHPQPDSDQHDMLIVSHRDTYVAPHRHSNKSETMLVLDGLADTLLFDEDGKLESIVPMGPYASDRTFFYRMPVNHYHGLRIETEFLTFLESTKGPFRKEDSENAPWAPPPEDGAAGKFFVKEITRRSCTDAVD